MEIKLDINEFELDGTANTVIFDLDGTLADGQLFTWLKYLKLPVIIL